MENRLSGLQDSLAEKDRLLKNTGQNARIIEDLNYKLAEAKAASISVSDHEVESLKIQLAAAQREIDELYEQNMSVEQEA